MKPAAVVIPTHNTLFYTRRCVESIIAYSHFYWNLPCRLIIVDNASTDGTTAYLRNLKGPVDVISNDRNQGWVKGVNQGLQRALDLGADPILFANSDIVIPGDPWWLNRYIDYLQNDDVGAVGPTSNYVMWMQHTQFSESLPSVHETTVLAGFFVATKARVLRKVGLLDDRFGSGGNDDLDLSIRIRQAGWKLLINRKAFVFHYGSRTLSPVFGGWEGIAREDSRTRAILVEKWGQEIVDELFVWPQEIKPYGES